MKKEKKKKWNQRQLVTVNWKTKKWLGGVKNKKRDDHIEDIKNFAV